MSSTIPQDIRKRIVDSKISEQKVLQSELTSLKKGAKVYKQQQYSNLYFLSSVDKEMAQSKKILDSLIVEYKDAERPSSLETGPEDT